MLLIVIRKPTKLVKSLRIAVPLLIVMITGGCEHTPELQQEAAHVTEPIKSPVPVDSIVPQVLKASNGDIVLSWLEPLPTKGYAFCMAIQHGDSWSDTRIISSGGDISMFQGDPPGVALMKDGSLLAYWQDNPGRVLQRRGSNLVRSDDVLSKRPPRSARIYFRISD